MEEDKKTVKTQSTQSAKPVPQAEKIAQVKNTVTVDKKESLVKKIPKYNFKNNAVMIVIVLLVVLSGIGSGWLLSGGAKASKTGAPTGDVAPGAIEEKMEAGIADEETFRDTAEGKLVEGGIDGEGTHHLDRGLGPDKNVYLTSTVIDLQSFVDKDVQVWGETISARKAGWLMDVGRIKVVE